MANSNYIRNVAIVGASGNSGSHMTSALLKGGKHTVTALTRMDSTSTLPEGVQVKQIDYANPSSIVEALRGQDVLIITLPGQVAHQFERPLIDAAAEAGVPWVLPNEWSPDTDHPGLQQDVPIFAPKAKNREYIASQGKSSYIGVNTGFWYEWSLGIEQSYGFNFEKRTVTFFDDGEVLTSMSTWPQVGRAVAALLSLPVQPEGGDNTRSLDRFRNKCVYVSSFTISQKDMLDSVMRVTGTKIDDWKITKESTKERYEKGVEDMKKGDRMGFVRMMYTRVFYPDDTGNFEKRIGTINDLLGLPKEDIDKATKVAIERQKNNTFG